MLPVVFKRLEDPSVDSKAKVEDQAKHLIKFWLVALMKVATDREAQYAILDSLELIFLYGTQAAAKVGLELKVRLSQHVYANLG